ncbi:BZ3500_MvSof-1268-A1-R1_Chr10-1g02697 [Microbotryum saponariae]|uniref:BZ3500_MvSof-1268-A1-R1_Chr10-1g02697 protein n=1 Tax=Microbotryum saponariae TaxID=289078 RepID=A0A2X0L773_9BASI|nr:BZ3500_MvSof-1268-A1-R1_Chr10-1g02697 [Microbotryum saponariae]SDA06186.1 BZ3501_MvSof-1269-A2-R1_Chr10-1g02298 [Microbotryum saponariae]
MRLFFVITFSLAMCMIHALPAEDHSGTTPSLKGSKKRTVRQGICLWACRGFISPADCCKKCGIADKNCPYEGLGHV